MTIVFIAAYMLTVAEFIASPLNVLRKNAQHMERFKAWRIPRPWAVAIAVGELVGASALVVGLWVHVARLAGGLMLTVISALLVAACLKSRYSQAFAAGLAFFGVLAAFVALYPC